MNLKGTKSEANLKAALMGESLARNKYTFYAQEAKREGNQEIVDLFERMAINETAHAKIWFKLLFGSKDSGQNLQEAAKGEFGEWSSMYPDFAKEAREEGLEELAVMFERVAAIEKDHERQFLMAYAQMISGKKDAPTQPEKEPVTQPGYRCLFCGATFKDRPDVCNVCGAIGSFDNCEILVNP